MQAVERVVEVSTLRHYASSLLGGREESQGLEVEFPFFPVLVFIGPPSYEGMDRPSLLGLSWP